MNPAPAEIDVFSRPHSRIKRLVDSYSQKLSATDFSDYTALKSFLSSLRFTFKEFKTHENIENECIMEKLKNRLNYHKVMVEEVAEVHSDDCLGKMNKLVEDGWIRTDSCSHSRDEMALIGNQLADALRKFTDSFLPHMQEEEEIFQPLLMKYFTYDELKEIRGDVLRKHSLFMTQDWEEKTDGEVECQDKVLEEELLPAKIQLLPSELTLKIFSYLNPKELCQCKQVCTQWNTLAGDPSFWTSLHPVRWAQGDWRFNISVEEMELEEDPYDNSLTCTIDEDADVDESESSGESDGLDSLDPNSQLNQIRREAKMLSGIVKYLLPAVGRSVQTINLSYSKSVTNGLVYKILQQTPNVKHLNLSSTKISDVAFKGLRRHHSCSGLEHLDLSGCVNITNLTLVRFGDAFMRGLYKVIEENPKSTSEFDKNGKRILNGSSPDRLETDSESDSGVCPNCGNVRKKRSSISGVEENVLSKQEERDSKLGAPSEKRTLKFLSLSGCFKITDEGLSALLDAGPYPYLHHLDLSGCLNVTARGLSDFVKACDSLNHEEFFYCDNILEGPYAQTASGCQNLECSNRVCCRSGE